jgi:hypothetical protein
MMFGGMAYEYRSVKFENGCDCAKQALEQVEAIEQGVQP